VEIVTGVATVLIASAGGAFWRLDKRSSVMDERIGQVLQEIKELRLDHKERLDDHEKRLRVLEQHQ
tara:strand:- start:81 stop:278 length:198 start_codon:yes stop_codon:yes gene_type:complete